jgi:hypothetical protein
MFRYNKECIISGSESIESQKYTYKQQKVTANVQCSAVQRSRLRWDGK